jgi:hypothetical protein
MNFKQTAFAAIAALSLFGAGQASATVLNVATFHTNFNDISTFDGVAFGSPTGVDVTVEFDPMSFGGFAGFGAIFQAASVTLDIAGMGTYFVTTPLGFLFTDSNFSPFGGAFAAAVVDPAGQVGFGSVNLFESPTVNLMDFFINGNPLPDTIAFTGDIMDLQAGPLTIQTTSGDTLVIDPQPVSEPGTLALLGIAGLGLLRRRRAA